MSVMDVAVYETPIESAFGIGDYEDVENKGFVLDSKVTNAQLIKQPDPQVLPPTIGNHYSKGLRSLSPAISMQTYECPVPTLSRVCVIFLCHPHSILLLCRSMDHHKADFIYLW